MDKEKCEDLGKFVVGDDPEKFFLGWSLAATSGEGGVGDIS